MSCAACDYVSFRYVISRAITCASRFRAGIAGIIGLIGTFVSAGAPFVIIFSFSPSSLPPVPIPYFYIIIIIIKFDRKLSTFIRNGRFSTISSVARAQAINNGATCNFHLGRAGRQMGPREASRKRAKSASEKRSCRSRGAIRIEGVQK